MNAEELAPYIAELEEWFRDRDVQIDPLPEIIFDDSNSPTDIFTPTGFYDYEAKTITVYVNGRHIKDIMRTISHELVHHSQNLADGSLGDHDLTGSIYTNQVLRDVESDAYLRGNTLFREWTEQHTIK